MKDRQFHNGGMPSWDSNQYLQFADQRTRPCRDLAVRVNIAAANRVIDLGCGPENSTAVLMERWPAAQITGLDSSPQMIESAQSSYPGQTWVLGDINSWNADGKEQFDVVYSNAALQWADDHAALFPRLMRAINPCGALAVQMPGHFDATAHRLMREIAAEPAWKDRFPPSGVREWHVHNLPFYYDVLSSCANHLDLWQTEYIHIMPSAQAILEWYKGTGLRPFLDALKSDDQQSEFLESYLTKLSTAYSPRADGKVLFPFRRLFIVAYAAK